MGALQSHVLNNPSILLWSAVTGLIFFFILLRKADGPKLPAINAYSWDLTRKKAHAEYIRNARGLVAQGFAKVCLLQNDIPV